MIGSYTSTHIQSQTKRHELVRRATALLIRSFSARFSLAELASSLDVSPRHVRDVFRLEVGQTPSKFVKALRIAKAKELLKAGVPIKQIAIDVGFFDQSHFSRYFKRFEGCTPAEYLHRNSQRKDLDN